MSVTTTQSKTKNAAKPKATVTASTQTTLRRSARTKPGVAPPSGISGKPNGASADVKTAKSAPVSTKRAKESNGVSQDGDAGVVKKRRTTKAKLGSDGVKASITSTANPAVPASPKLEALPTTAQIANDDSTPESLKLSERIADPKSTNAPLIEPQLNGSSDAEAGVAIDTLASTSQNSKSSNNDNNAESPTSLLPAAQAHLISLDARFSKIIENNPCPVFTNAALSEPVDPFRSLVSSIISQQVSGAAAKSIKNKFIRVCLDLDEKDSSDATLFPSPSIVSSTPIEKLRSAGLSQRKAEYIQGLATKFVNGELTTSWILDATDEEIVEELIKVRGLGKWSVEMFCCFELKRLDVFSTGDLGVQYVFAPLAPSVFRC